MVEPKKMCTQHLLGEHLECHMFVGAINKGIKVNGYVSKKLLQIQNLKERHNEIAEEIKRRNFEKHGIVKEHKSPIEKFNVNYCKHIKIDINKNEQELYRRCINCRKRIDENAQYFKDI